MQAELRGDGAHAGIGDALAEDDVAGLGEQTEDADQRAMRAGRQEDALLRRHQRAAAEPRRGRVAIERRAAKTLVAQQRVEIGADARDAFAHARQQRRILGLRRHVHREIGARTARRRVAGDHRLPADEGAAADGGFDQPALAGFDIAARDGGEIELQALGEIALRRQAVARREPAGRDVGRDRVGDRQISGAVAVGERRAPSFSRQRRN